MVFPQTVLVLLKIMDAHGAIDPMVKNIVFIIFSEFFIGFYGV